MEYRNLGTSGLRVSVIGLGCNNLGRPGTASYSQEGTTALIDSAIDAGVTLFDTADIYGEEFGLSETLLGEALRGRRERVVLATKFGHSDRHGPREAWGAKGSRRYVRLAVEDSLRRLQTDWIDLYQLHTPDPATPIEETLSVLDDLVREGKVRYIGHSNLDAWQAVDADWTARTAGLTRFVSAQNEYSLLRRGVERELLPALEKTGMGFLPYFPLFNGVFTGKFTRDGGPADSRIMRQRPHVLDEVPWDAVERFRSLCEEWGVGMLEATFVWLLSRPQLASVIAGATTPEQIARNAVAADAWHPDGEQLDRITELFPLD
ncbi:aryl-alcohol dehydrogenase-like predicted oxidoreductase [Diaminobutyricimonas aerilata]|uniref:Aryl-alcohol dehydrogenase-like predicted oxidoreductase n=2 Tax=Diaminobutyricimonas aerilata TaxID=1162967 RepID=A0A2M9CLH9_9MICO|nr:aryl-alcohol dehydrogenase-like predicted oxidoreductase [Diaminobutyricimonas aerilata]